MSAKNTAFAQGAKKLGRVGSDLWVFGSTSPNLDRSSQMLQEYRFRAYRSRH